MKPNPFSRVLNKFMSNWDDLSPSLKTEISAQLETGATPYEAVAIVFKKHDLREKLAKWIADACIGGAEKGGVSFTSNLTGRNYFLGKVFEKDGVNLSARVLRGARWRRQGVEKDVQSPIISRQSPIISHPSR